MPPPTSFFTKTLGSTAGDAVNICITEGTQGIGYGVQLSVVESTASRDRVYRVNVKVTDNPVGWRRLVPSDRTEAGTTWGVDVLVEGRLATFRLVRTQSGVSSSTLKCKVMGQSAAGGSVVITVSDTTASGVVNVGTYEGALITQVGGNVGIGTDTPTATLDVNGSVNISGTDGNVNLNTSSLYGEGNVSLLGPSTTIANLSVSGNLSMGNNHVLDASTMMGGKTNPTRIRFRDDGTASIEFQTVVNNTWSTTAQCSTFTLQANKALTVALTATVAGNTTLQSNVIMNGPPNSIVSIPNANVSIAGREVTFGNAIVSTNVTVWGDISAGNVSTNGLRVTALSTTGNASMGNVSTNAVSATAVSVTSLTVGGTNLNTLLAAKENTITASTTGTYYRGDKTFQTLNTNAVPEGSNLYFTNARAQAALTTELNAKANGTNAVITGTLSVSGNASIGNVSTNAISATIMSASGNVSAGNISAGRIAASAFTLNNTAWASYVVHSTSTPFSFTGPGSSLSNGVPFFAQTEANGTAFVTPSGTNNSVFTFATNGVYMLQTEIDAGFPFFPEADISTYYIKNANPSVNLGKESHSPSSFSCTRPFLITANANDNVRFIIDSNAGNDYEVGLNSSRITMLKFA